MSRYHINPHTGDPGTCTAKIACPYGSFDADHFDSPEAARAAYEAGHLDSAFTTLSKALDETLDPVFVQRRTYEEEGGVQIETSLVRARDLKQGDRVWDASLKKTFTVVHEDGRRVLRGYGEADVDLDGPEGDFLEARVDRVVRPESSDDELLAAIDKAGWPKYDPSMPDSHFDQSDVPEGFGSWTDEAMHAYDELATPVFYSTTEETPDGPIHHVSVNTGLHTFDLKTSDSRDVIAAQRIAEAGEWDYLVASGPADLKSRVTTVGRYLRKRDAAGYIADAKLDLRDELDRLGSSSDPKTTTRRAELTHEYELLEVAENVLTAEARARAFESAGDPPF